MSLRNELKFHYLFMLRLSIAVSGRSGRPLSSPLDLDSQSCVVGDLVAHPLHSSETKVVTIPELLD